MSKEKFATVNSYSASLEKELEKLENAGIWQKVEREEKLYRENVEGVFHVYKKLNKPLSASDLTLQCHF